MYLVIKLLGLFLRNYCTDSECDLVFIKHCGRWLGGFGIALEKLQGWPILISDFLLAFKQEIFQFVETGLQYFFCCNWCKFLISG